MSLMNFRKILSFVLAFSIGASCLLLQGKVATNIGSSPFTHQQSAKPRLAAAALNAQLDLTAQVIDITTAVAKNQNWQDPYSLALSVSGDLYIVEGGDANRIEHLEKNGNVTVIAGHGEGYADGVASNAQFNTPSGVAFDPQGNLYIADTANNRIRKIAINGEVSTVAGNGTGGFRDGDATQAQFNGPLGIAVDTRGNIYVADTYNDRIRLITPSGTVSTLAGSDHPGFADGVGADARFDSPCGVAVDTLGNILIADTHNNAIRKLTPSGIVSTLARTATTDKDGLLASPVGLAIDRDGLLWSVQEGSGKIVVLTPDQNLFALTTSNAAYADIDGQLRLRHPSGLAIDADGNLLVSDPVTSSIYRIVRGKHANDASSAPTNGKLGPKTIADNFTHGTPHPWPISPQNQAHEVVGVMGEIRGNYSGESRDHLHAGLDIQARLGAQVLAIENAKVSRPLPNWSFNSINEGFRLDNISYIHLRVGRDSNDHILDPERFSTMERSDGEPPFVRIKRGTRFHVGDVLGTVNKMYHSHIDYFVNGTPVNPFNLNLIGLRDRIPPRIEDIRLVDQSGHTLKPQKRHGIVVPAGSEDLSIVVRAFDRMDGNSTKRHLGLYQLGYQVLQQNGRPATGYETPRTTIEFNQLTRDEQAPKLIYAEGSGITVHGNAQTRFDYVISNIARDGTLEAASWKVGELAPGHYILRIFAKDFAGNVATSGRDLKFSVE